MLEGLEKVKIAICYFGLHFEKKEAENRGSGYYFIASV